MPAFSFDPTAVDYPISASDNNEDDKEENRIDTVAIEIAQQ